MPETEAHRGPCPMCGAGALIEKSYGGWPEADDWSSAFIIRCADCGDLGETDATAEAAVARVKPIAASRHLYELRGGQLWPVVSGNPPMAVVRSIGERP